MTTTRSNGSLYTKIDNKIAYVEFGHPAGNSFVKELLERLTNEIHNLSATENVSIVVLKSEGNKAFCGGASFDELKAINNLEEGIAFFSGFAHLLNAMRSCKKPIIGRVQGRAVGGGIGIIAACDYIFASENASIKLSELALGIGPFVIAPAVERKIGVSGFAELSLSPKEWKNAYWARDRGLFSNVYPDLKELDKALDTYLNELSQYSPKALEELKSILWKGTENWSELLLERAAISAKLCLSEHTKSVLSKFK